MSEVVPSDDTPPMGLTVGDRVALERRIDQMQAVFDERSQNATTIREQLIRRFDSLHKWVWIAFGMAVASLVVQLVRIAVVLVLREAS